MLVKIFLQKETKIFLKGRSLGHRGTVVFLRFWLYFPLCDLSLYFLPFFVQNLPVWFSIFSITQGDSG